MNVLLRILLPLFFLMTYSFAARPNILFLFTDDHATQAISAYQHKLKLNKTPNLDRLAREGMLFQRCLVTNSICAPSRAVVLTGKYSHMNGQRTNRDIFDGSQVTFPKLLRKAGYQTSIIGKWHLKSEPTGFDHYEVLKGQGQYYNPMLKTNGKEVKHTGYTTDIITDQALKWIKNRDPKKPFMLMSQHKAPHGRWEPALRHLGMYDGQTLPEPDSLFDNYKGRGKAAKGHKMGIADHMGPSRLMFRYSSKFTPEQFKKFDGYFRPLNEAHNAANLEGEAKTRWNYQRYIKNYLSCVKAVDGNVGRLLDYLDESGLAENTVVIYSSDQGFYLGEHGWFDKRWMYDESLRTPLIIRWPGVTQPGSVNSDIVSNLDYAETMLEMAGVKVPKEMHGRSLVPILKGKTPEDWRKTFYYQYYESGGHGVPAHYGIATKRYKLMHFHESKIDEWEFYDMETDPNEMQSVYGQKAYSRVIAGLKSKLRNHQEELKVDEENR